MKQVYYTIILILFFSCSNQIKAQNSFSPQPKAPVIFKEDTLFVIKNKIGVFSAADRAKLVHNNILQLAKLPLEEFDSIKVIDYESSADIVYQNKVISSVSLSDASLEGKTPIALANERKNAIYRSLVKDYNDHSFSNIWKDILLFIGALILLTIVFTYVNRIFNYWRRNLKTLERNFFFRDNKIIKFFRMITPEAEREILLFTLRMTRVTVLGLFLYFYLPFLFSQISYTRGFGEKLFEYVLNPVRFLMSSFASFLPKLLFIVIILIAVRYLIRGVGYFAKEVQSERLHLPGFYPDWAKPTFNLTRILIIIFTLVIIFPYLPGSGSEAFQGVSVFVGLLLSLGSAGAISNMVSGVILTYMRPFKTGDRVKINDIVGDIISKNLLVTKIRTLKNEEVTVPNASLLGGGIVNYSSLAEDKGLILHTSVTIGYDAPWKVVHELLIKAALRTTNLEKDPAPFVLQKSLDDWYVAYELNAYTKDSHKIPKTYSDLHANIQDVFNESEVEIMSSHYLALRDGNQAAIPLDYLSEKYRKPAFKVDNS